MLKTSFLTVLITSVFSVLSQTAKVKLNMFVEDEKGKKMQSIIAVYKYNGQPFEDPINIGVETKKASGKFNAKLPNMGGIKDTSYAYIYFGALNERNTLPGYVFVIIGNNKRTKSPALLWIDRNNNLDLSDDGAPDTFYNNVNNKDIVLINPKNKNASYTLNISRYDFATNPKYIALLDDYYKENSGIKQFSGSLYSFRELRINCIAGDIKIGNDSFRIGIKDANCNGFYNDESSDFILFGDYKVPILPDNRISIINKKGKTYFERLGKKYVISEIDPLGNYISIYLDENAKIKNSLVVGKKIKKFKFENTDIDKKMVSIKKYKKKPTYIYVWRFNQVGFDKDTAILRTIVNQYGNKIDILTLNYGETPKELKTFKRKAKLNWTIGQSTMKINQKLFIEQYPTGILTKKKLRVQKISISPSELLDLLQTNQL